MGTTIARNRKARHDYFIEDTMEAGIALVGTEVKSCREGRASFKDAYCDFIDGELYLLQMHISPYTHASPQLNHDPERPRKLLLHKRELRHLLGKIKEKGLTIVPLAIYLKNNRIKVEIALAKGKRQYDKRETIKKRDVDRQLRAAVKERFSGK